MGFPWVLLFSRGTLEVVLLPGWGSNWKTLMYTGVHDSHELYTASVELGNVIEHPGMHDVSRIEKTGETPDTTKEQAPREGYRWPATQRQAGGSGLTKYMFELRKELLPSHKY